jgi:hypothetical protein
MYAAPVVAPPVAPSPASPPASQVVRIANASPYRMHYTTTSGHASSHGTIPPAPTLDSTTTMTLSGGPDNPILSYAIGIEDGARGSASGTPRGAYCMSYVAHRDGSLVGTRCAAPATAAAMGAAHTMAPWDQTLFLANRTADTATVTILRTGGADEVVHLVAGESRTWRAAGPRPGVAPSRMERFTVSTPRWTSDAIPLLDAACVSLAITEHGLVRDPSGPPDCHDGGDGMGGAGFNPSGRGTPHIG